MPRNRGGSEVVGLAAQPACDGRIERSGSRRRQRDDLNIDALLVHGGNAQRLFGIAATTD
jgi:hypothetical protein